MNFSTKQLNQEPRSCFRLKYLREEQGVSLHVLSEKLKISKAHLVALESGELKELPFAPIYQKKLVAQYCGALNIDATDIVNQFVEEELEPLETNATPVMTKRLSLSHWYNLPLLFRVGATLTLAILFFSYLGLQVKKIVDPPRLTLSSPINGMISQDANIQIEGQTDKEVKITINGKEISNTDQGSFEQTLTLSPGVNTLVISAEKKHGKTTTETRHVIFEQPHAFTLTETENPRN